MKKLLFIIIAAVFTGCGNGNREVNADSSNVITDSAALMNTDTTRVLGDNHLKED